MEAGKWHPARIETVNKKTGELKDKPLYVFKPEMVIKNLALLILYRIIDFVLWIASAIASQ
jgi:hypothetical protein